VSGILSEREPTPWLAQHGPKEIELLLRAVLFQPTASILLADDDRRYLDASFGASKLLGRPREKLIGCRLDDFLEPIIEGHQEQPLKVIAMPDALILSAEPKHRHSKESLSGYRSQKHFSTLQSSRFD
jgi:PAS domain-containing protein